MRNNAAGSADWTIFQSCGVLALGLALLLWLLLMISTKDPCKFEGKEKGCPSAIAILSVLLGVCMVTQVCCGLIEKFYNTQIRGRFPRLERVKWVIKWLLRAALALVCTALDMFKTSSYSCLAITSLLFWQALAVEYQIPWMRRFKISETLLSMSSGILLSLDAVYKSRWTYMLVMFLIPIWKAYFEGYPRETEAAAATGWEFIDLESQHEGRVIPQEQLNILQPVDTTPLVADHDGKIYNDMGSHNKSYLKLHDTVDTTPLDEFHSAGE